MKLWKRKKTWTKVRIKKSNGYFEVFLDEKRILTPESNKIELPTKNLALAIAKEWDIQKDVINKKAMPYNGLVNSAIDNVSMNFQHFIEKLIDYADTETICYRAESPEELVLLQSEQWDPLLNWLKTEFEINLELRAGIKYKSQSTVELEKLRPLLTGYDNFKLTSLYNLVALSGSLIISLAVLRGNLTAEKGWEIAMLEENWQREQWGQDEESIHHYENKLAEFITAQNFSKLLR